MYTVTLTMIVNDNQYNNHIISADNKHETELAFEGKLLGLDYETNGKNLVIQKAKNKVRISFNKTVIIFALKRM